MQAVNGTVAATPAYVRDGVWTIREIGPTLALVFGVMVFGAFLLWKKVIPHWQEMEKKREDREQAQDKWVQDQVENAQKRLDETYQRIPTALERIAAQMTESGKVAAEIRDSLRLIIAAQQSDGVILREIQRHTAR